MNDFKNIAFAAITFYPKWHKGEVRSIADTDKIRGDLALEFIRKATDKKFRVVIVDGKSSKSFKTELKKFPNIRFTGRNGFKRSPAKRKAFKIASKLPDVKVIIATEAEKVSIIDSALNIAKPIIEDKADIVIPRRNEKLFKETFPDYMFESETEGNRLYISQLENHGIKVPDNLDLFFGPRAFANNPKVLNLFYKKSFPELTDEKNLKQYFDPEEYANAQFFPVVYALKKGFKVADVEIPFKYPETQKANETQGAREFFEEKRKAQKMGILLELMHLLNYLK